MMMGRWKRWALLKRLRKETAMKWKLLGAFRWKRMTSSIRVSLFDNVLFKILSVFEAIVLVSTVCCFYLCFGCHF
ncbi:uncharacterized protein LOC116215555 [Punica granatum]|uniref:Uncharacterized protein LOC116215555 n=1 Tax=Punica granatum TaxID=22663 RepID=A0A6P8EAX9_PUNGR|nr:uncharacterized protein LOC116215555 [Punica granatum]